MFERQGAQNLDTNVVAEEVFKGDDRTCVAVDVDLGASDRAVAILRGHVTDAEPQGHIACGLSERGRGQGGGGETGKKKRSHGYSHCFDRCEPASEAHGKTLICINSSVNAGAAFWRASL